MNKWLWLLLTIACWMAAGFAVCRPGTGQARDNSAPPARPDRIVSMAPSLTEILFALGLDKEIVGVTEYSDYPPAVMNKPKVGSFWQPNIESVVAARPDLVLTVTTTGFDQQKRLAMRLTRIGYNCATLKIETMAELFEGIRKIGEATGRSQQADELVSSIKEKLKKLSALVGTEEKVRVLWVVQREPLRVAGRDTFVNELIELAGGENAVGPTLHKYPPIGAEQVIASKTQVIIEPDMGQHDLIAQQQSAIRYWTRFENLPAATDKRIYVIPGGAVSRLGPRLYEATETIAECLRPHLFEN
ncbi:MAG: ABC transporter substrate-binding protein [Phycisphaerales bacterium]|nr:MAG: ABC transporter substrate-binding protein [Phycisphaerales bacterium]